LLVGTEAEDKLLRGKLHISCSFHKAFTVMEGMNMLAAGIVFETYKILSESTEVVLLETVPYRLQL
jgi:hypothetical protein